MSKEDVFESWTRSPCEMIEICHVWTIEKFSLRDKFLRSSTFSANQDDFDAFGNKREWMIELYPRGIKEENKDYKDRLVLLLKLVNPTEMEVNCTYSLLDERGNCLRKCKKLNKILMTVNGIGGVIGKRDEFQDKFPNDVLKIKCDLSYLKEVGNVSGTGAEEPVRKRAKCDLSDNFGTLLTDVDFNDVTLSIGDVEKIEFKAHRAILAARSSYFAAMFKSDFREKRENVIEIKDVSPAIFKEILAFIYTAKEPKNLAESAKEILEAADRFNLEILKSLAEDFLTSKLTIQNVSELLVLADRHSANILKTRATNYAAANLKEVMKTEGWDIMYQEHPDLTKEPILKAINGPSK